MRHNLAGLTLVCLLLGCQPSAPAPAPAPAPEAETGQRQSVIGAPLHEALERAESVQQTLDTHAEAMRRELEEAEGNGRRAN
jgi:hypothetical protein